jgi:hypothetical protein
MIPVGRGFYIWVLARCEGGDVNAIIDRCQRCGVSWLAIKIGNAGSSWIPTFRKKNQLTTADVEALHAAGLKVFGWSYDLPGSYRTKDGRIESDPGILDRQAKAYSTAIAIGCDGVITDSEVEWNRAVSPDTEAASFGKAILERCPNIVIGDAPWPYTGYHPTFPFTKFGEFVSFRCPQVYWMEISGGVQKVCETYAKYWDEYESNPQHPKRPHLPSGSIYDKSSHGVTAKLVTVEDIAFFERFVRGRGCPGVLHWEYSQVPKRIWEAFESGQIPRWQSGQ